MNDAGSHSLPETLYSADAVREIDRYVIEGGHVDGFELMQRAAAATFRHLVKVWPEPGLLLVLCGAGNNGGDGYLVAASAVRHGWSVACVAVADPQRLQGDARRAWQKAEDDGVPVQRWQDLDSSAADHLFDGAGLIVDAMLGTGVRGAPRGDFADLIARCNAIAAPVLAVDLPSGLDATTGQVAGEAVKADLTVTFIGLKTGLFTAQGPAYTGRVVFDDLDIEALLPQSGQAPQAWRRNWQSLAVSLPRRPATAHKGRFGHLLVVAGDRGFGGAALLAAEAAARSGAGLVTLATRPEHVAPALTRCPSLMVQGVIHGSELPPLLARATAVVCGPGLGQGSWGQQMLQQVLVSELPQILDADALNLMATRVPVRAGNHVLTPHPGEAARLLGVSVPEVEADRLAAAVSLQQTFGGTVLLKGAGTVIVGDEGLPTVIDGSNPGLATGGMGDVLSGIIAALLAQTGDPRASAEMAAALHLAAADRASRQRGFMGLLPMDVIDRLPELLGTAEGVVAPAGPNSGMLE